jgi:hypothetical protein
MRDELLSAQLVCDTNEDFDQIQFQLQQQGQQLQQVLTGLQTNNTVHVVCPPGGALPNDTSLPGSEDKDSASHSRHSRK